MVRVTGWLMIIPIHKRFLRHLTLLVPDPAAARNACLAAAFLTALAASPAGAAPLSFDEGWKEQGFLRLWTNDYAPDGTRLRITSDGTVSLFYRAMPRTLWQAKKARWQWMVEQSVIATDLARKGGDDRNLAVYFVFADEAVARRLSRASAARLMRHKGTRALIYVWGGSEPPGTILPSPYGKGRLKTVVQRPAGTGSFRESVDLIADYRRAFGQEPGVLVGVAISADSDDTAGRIRAEIRDLELF